MGKVSTPTDPGIAEVQGHKCARQHLQFVLLTTG